MGDVAMLAQARRELEELYSGVPDESVNLTFQDFVELKQQNGIAERKKHNMEAIPEINLNHDQHHHGSLGKSPSLDFAKALKAAAKNRRNQVEGETIYSSRDHSYVEREDGNNMNRDHRYVEREGVNMNINDHRSYVQGKMFPYYSNPTNPNNFQRSTTSDELKNTLEGSFICDDMSGISISSSRNPYQSTHDQRRGRKRPGIPHSNICTVCSTYVYIFRHRCLVCGRVYCRYCKSVGMGEMTEGRKCVECLGRRFSQRYIQKAGAVGCCSGYPSIVKQQELKWAEKGPRGSGERRGRTSSIMMMSTTGNSRSRSPVTPINKMGGGPHHHHHHHHHHQVSGPTSFVSMSSSPYSINHPIPF